MFAAPLIALAQLIATADLADYFRDLHLSSAQVTEFCNAGKTSTARPVTPNKQSPNVSWGLRRKIFADVDPPASLRQVQRVRDRGFDLRTGDGSLFFRPALPRKCYSRTSATSSLWDRMTMSYIKVYVQFPSFYSEATITNGVGGLDVYSEPDEPSPL